VPGFLWLGWWQLHRALAGNHLSWAYTVEWPFFSIYAVYMWWKLVHESRTDRASADAERSANATTFDRDPQSPEPRLAPTSDAVRSTEERELDAYNRYLASLSRSDDRRSK